jgi:hypothetical protein
MKRKNLLMSLTLAGALSALGSQAHATSWMDFDVSNVQGPLSADRADPTVLNQVTVVCPATGFLIATANSSASFRNQGGGRSSAFVVFTISIERNSADANNTVASQDLEPTNNLVTIPASLQRVDACNSGDTRTYYLVAHGGAADPATTFGIEGLHKLVVQFFDTRI